MSLKYKACCHVHDLIWTVSKLNHHHTDTATFDNTLITSLVQVMAWSLSCHLSHYLNHCRLNSLLDPRKHTSEKFRSQHNNFHWIKKFEHVIGNMTIIFSGLNDFIIEAWRKWLSSCKWHFRIYSFNDKWPSVNSTYHKMANQGHAFNSCCPTKSLNRKACQCIDLHAVGWQHACPLIDLNIQLTPLRMLFFPPKITSRFGTMPPLSY